MKNTNKKKGWRKPPRKGINYDYFLLRICKKEKVRW